VEITNIIVNKITKNMKKYILSTIFATIILTGLNAQDYKWWAGGRMTLWTNKEYSKVVVAPEIGYHLSNRFTVAASVGFHSYSYYDDVTVSSDRSGFVLNPYIRYNAFRKGIISGYIDGGAEFGISDIKGFNLGLKPGIAIHLTERFCVALHFGFIGYRDGKGDGYGINQSAKGVGIDLSGYQSGFGFFYSF
jgi:hypothetical protein